MTIVLSSSEYAPCASCDVKPGSYVLCPACLHNRTLIDRMRDQIAILTRDLAAPIPMLLTCPFCRGRHIDVGEFATKSHHTHACQHDGCGMVWRPALVPTVGVEFLPGFKNVAP